MPARATGVRVEEEVSVRATGTRTTTYKIFGNLTLYVLRCVMQTSLGQEIAAAAIPCSKCVLTFANKFKYPAHYISQVSKLLLSAFVVLSLLLGADVLKDGIYRLWVIRVLGFLAVVYLLPLVFIYFMLIYIPLRAVVMPLAMVFPVSDAGSCNNEFYTITYGERLTVTDIDLSSHIFAARLQRMSTIKLMVYEAKWVENNLSVFPFVAELYMCSLAIVWWFVLEPTVHWGGAPWWPFSGDDGQFSSITSLLGIAAALAAMHIGLVLTFGLLLPLAWGILNIVLCTIPSKILHCIRAQACKKVLQSLDDNRADIVSFCES